MVLPSFHKVFHPLDVFSVQSFSPWGHIKLSRIFSTFLWSTRPRAVYSEDTVMNKPDEVPARTEPTGYQTSYSLLDHFNAKITL